MNSTRSETHSTIRFECAMAPVRTIRSIRPEITVVSSPMPSAI
jgi:hypothetical protein